LVGGAALPAVAVWPAAIAQGAEASTRGWADSNGYVPVYSVCYSGIGALAYYSWFSDGYGHVVGTIYVDDCLLADYGAGPYDRQRVIDHEMGYARCLPRQLRSAQLHVRLLRRHRQVVG
jgi:hypothetical protein